MKARPILFSAPMVQALLDGRKTQTRRVVKMDEGMSKTLQDPLARNVRCHAGGIVCDWGGGTFSTLIRCPYGKPGDLLWVRETWAKNEGKNGGALYRADVGECSSFRQYDLHSAEVLDSMTTWKPSIHMPRWASRLTLEIIGVRVERLQDISEADAKAEGCFFTDYGRRCFHGGQGNPATCPAKEEYHPQKEGWMWKPTTSSDQCIGSARYAYCNLWESINGTGSWDANPFVWVLEFQVHHCNVDELLKARAA